MRASPRFIRLACTAAPLLAAACAPPRRGSVVGKSRGASAATPGGREAPDRAVRFRMSPVIASEGLTSLAIEVQLFGDASGTTEIRLPEQWASERELWKYVRDLEIEGATSVETPEPAVRIVHGAAGAPLTVRYAVVSAYPEDPRATDGQPFAPIIRPTWFYAFGEALFATPSGRDDAPAQFAWVGAPNGFGFVSDLESVNAHGGTVGDVSESIALGGVGVRTQTRQIENAEVRVGIYGDYTFTDAEFADMGQTILASEREFWNEHGDPFTIVLAPLRPVKGHRSKGGTGRSDAFTILMGQDTPIEDLRHLIAHEYFHTWNPRRIGGQQDGDAEMHGKWFSEGFTEFYTWRLLLRSGLYELEDFVGAWNSTLLAYATSSARNAPRTRVMQEYWADRDVGKLPYQQGPLLAAMWEPQIREASGGTLGLDDVLYAMRAKIREGARPADAASVFVTTVHELSGLDLEPDLARFLDDGETIVLPPAVLGSCVRVETREGEVPVQQLVLQAGTTRTQREGCRRSLGGFSDDTGA